jgi:drug/metabolite transporter (DMT)-like permease
VIIEVISIGYGVCSMIGGGFGDFLAKRTLGTVGPHRLMLYTQLLCLALAFPLVAAFPRPIPSSPTTIALIMATGICSFSALFFFYGGLALGKASIVTPIVSSSSVVAIALSFAILGETLTLPQTLCIAATVAGALIITGKSHSSARLNA